ncbi:12023_t:CDS:2 [Ambispora leptoticha]|uniref:Geranylgeranyl transferase type-1 subunit beta n=1 Tax=Ambispora leptoticha TaxID=144679 RepID=A0A9N8Z140_9GLOM|nr:12023_t:CDS:2 [Ambispora leptoticha]
MATHPSPAEFTREKHVSYLKMCLELLPHEYESFDTNRMTFAYFCLSGLDLLDVLDSALTPERRRGWIDWIYAQQILPNMDNPADNEHLCGFRGSPFSGSRFDVNGVRDAQFPVDAANLAMTYTALCCLLLLKDDLSRVDRPAIINAMRYLQNEDGSFSQTYQSLESDIRFIYCACAISYILNDFSGFDTEKAVDYIKKSQTYDYGIAQSPDQESHGGSTYCAISALHLLNRIDEGLLSKDKTIFWCLSRQISGFQGRPNKPQDTCYSFWIGGALKLLNAFDLVDFDSNRAFLMTTQSKHGGFAKLPPELNKYSKWINYPADPLHTYMGIAALSLMRDPGFVDLDPALNISKRTIDRLINESVFWKK